MSACVGGGYGESGVSDCSRVGGAEWYHCVQVRTLQDTGGAQRPRWDNMKRRKLLDSNVKRRITKWQGEQEFSTHIRTILLD